MRNKAIATTWLLAALLGLAVPAGAQTVIPLPSYSSTFSDATRTRGFYFQSPVDFTVVGLRVPDEKSHGTQHVALYKMSGKPPAYPTTATGGLQFFKTGEPSSVVIPCQVSYLKNEWFGVLGACGDASTMHNSYGSSQYPSNVLGQTVTLLRFITQTNLVVASGLGGYSNEDSGTLSRVEVYVQPYATLVGSGTGAPGSTITLTLNAASEAGLPYQLGSSFGAGPIPIDQRQLGLTPDDLLVLSTGGLLPAVFQDYAGTLDNQGQATGRLNIPNVPALKGLRLHTAFVTLQASAPSGISHISNTFMFTIQ